MFLVNAPRLEMILDLPLLCEDRAKFNAGEQIIGVGVSICLADEFVERIEIQPRIAQPRVILPFPQYIFSRGMSRSKGMYRTYH